MTLWLGKAEVTRRLSLRWALVAIALFAAGALIGAYLVSRIAASGTSVASPDANATYRVAIETLERSVTYPAVVRWNTVSQVFAPRSGTITDLTEVAGLLSAGDIVARIDERPVTIIPGSVPAFRALSVGTSGRDVASLHAYLAALGYPVEADGTEFSDSTAAAVRAWQSDVGYPASGEVELGDVIFIDSSALRDHPFRLTDDLAVGSLISPGTPLLQQLEATPAAEVNLGPLPPAEIVPGSTVMLTFDRGDGLPASVAELTGREGQVIAALASAEGGPFCAQESCLELIPLRGDSVGSAEITLVPATTGPVVPSAALLTSAAGDAYVELAGGGKQNVSIVLSAGGLTVVEGVDVGTEIVVP